MKMKMKRGGRKEIKFWEPWWVGRTVDLGRGGRCPVLYGCCFTFPGKIWITDKKAVDSEYSRSSQAHDPHPFSSIRLHYTVPLPRSPRLRDESGLQISKPSSRDNNVTDQGSEGAEQDCVSARETKNRTGDEVGVRSGYRRQRPREAGVRAPGCGETFHPGHPHREPASSSSWPHSIARLTVGLSWRWHNGTSRKWCVKY